MDAKLAALGCDFEPSKYTPDLGYSRLRVAISGKPTQRFFDVKAVHIPTFDGRLFHQTLITRHELEPRETFQVCLGEMRLETYKGESLLAFTFGGTMQVTIDRNDLYCEFNSSAPIFKVKEDPGSVGVIITDEIMDLLAEKQAKMTFHEDELYSHLAKFTPYQIFLASLVSLQKRADAVPMNLRREEYHKVVAALHRANDAIKNTDGWDGHSPSLDDLLSGENA